LYDYTRGLGSRHKGGNMKSILISLVLLLAVVSNATTKRYFQDAKFPSQKMIEKQSIDDPAAAGSADVLSAHAGATSAAAASTSTCVAQPDVPRNLVVTPGGTTADVGTCTVTVTGKNILGSSISESFAFVANTTLATTGAKAFKEISTVAWAASCEDSPYTATWSVGYGEKLGVKYCLDNTGDIIKSLLNGAVEGTAPTMVVDADEVEKNTADYNGTMNGSNDFVLYFMQNNRCGQ
jgi:hypothetical protein